MQQVFEKLQLILSRNEAEAILADMRAANNGKFECSFKDFIDFLTKRRINSAFNDKGFVDPMIAQCCQQLSRCAQTYEISYEKIFDLFDTERRGLLSKDHFLKSMQGMELGVAVEDMVEFFNFIDDRSENSITKLQFVDSVTFVNTKLASKHEALAVGVSQTKKGSSVKQQVVGIIRKVSEAVQNKRLAMR